MGGPGGRRPPRHPLGADRPGPPRMRAGGSRRAGTAVRARSRGPPARPRRARRSGGPATAGWRPRPPGTAAARVVTPAPPWTPSHHHDATGQAVSRPPRSACTGAVHVGMARSGGGLPAVGSQPAAAQRGSRSARRAASTGGWAGIGPPRGSVRDAVAATGELSGSLGTVATRRSPDAHRALVVRRNVQRCNSAVNRPRSLKIVHCFLMVVSSCHDRLWWARVPRWLSAAPR